MPGNVTHLLDAIGAGDQNALSASPDGKAAAVAVDASKVTVFELAAS